MIFTQRKKKWLALLMLLVAFAVQGILAAHACISPESSAAASLTVKSDVESISCHQAEKTAPNACLMHCTQSDQVNLGHHAMPAAPTDDIVLLVAMPSLQHKALPATCTPVVQNTGPPLSIRFCSFLI